MKKGIKYSWLIIGVISLIALFAPIIIVYTTYSPDLFTGFPGESAAWFGFWASYSGTLATLLVALITWKNSRGIEKLQRRYYELDTDVNLRLSKISIVPHILKLGKLNQYKMIFVFENMAKNLIREIGISEIKDSDGECRESKRQIVVTIGKVTETLNITKSEYYLQDGKPVIQFYLKINKPPLKEMFAGFYYYFSQFSLDIPKMELKMEIDIRYGDSPEESTTRELLVELMPTPMIEHRRKYLEFSEEEYAAESYEILIGNCKLGPVK